MSDESELRSFFDRWLNLEERKAAVSEDLKELFSEAKSRGFEPKAMRIAFKGKVRDESETEDDRALAAMVYTYRAAIDAPHAHPAPAREKTLKKSVRSETADHTSSPPHEADASGETNSNPQEPTSSPATADKAEAPVSSPGASAAFTLRPHCLNPESCAGYGSKHCHACLKAAQESEAA